ncbi:hypothetical protein FRC12_002911 [Ceratobasidium sp. 428]|nr:hypothetical protein FRC12_002911 [Ceratobasidium sp. 428]
MENGAKEIGVRDSYTPCSVTSGSPSIQQERRVRHHSHLRDIPELLELIASYLPRKDALALALSSRTYFSVVVPVVWHTVPGTRCLWALLQGAKLRKKSSKSHSVIILPELKTCDFTRFNVYAPFVKHLHIFRTSFYEDKIHDRNALLRHTKRHILLPNLKRITFSSNISIDQYFWFSIFLSPDLSAIEASYANFRPNIDSAGASRLLEKVVSRCPSLQELRLFPLFLVQRTSMPRPSFVPFWEHIASMKELRSLSTSRSMLSTDALKYLGNLERLETLKIYGRKPIIVPTECTIMDAGSFPALRQLWLPQLEPREIQLIWCVNALVKGLRVVKLGFKQSDIESVSSLISYIYDRSPHLIDLALRLDEASAKSSPYPLLGSLKRLTLEKLEMSGIVLAPLELACESLFYAAPLLRELRLSDSVASLMDLRHFTRFSQLKSLSLIVDWESPITPMQGDSTSRSQNFQYLECNGWPFPNKEHATAQEATR